MFRRPSINDAPVHTEGGRGHQILTIVWTRSTEMLYERRQGGVEISDAYLGVFYVRGAITRDVSFMNSHATAGLSMISFWHMKLLSPLSYDIWWLDLLQGITE